MSYSEQKIVERFFEVYKLNRRYSERKYGPFMPGRGQFNCLLVLHTESERLSRLFGDPLDISRGALKKNGEKRLDQKRNISAR